MGSEAEGLYGLLRGVTLHSTSMSTSVATSSVSEGDLLVDMQPLRIQLGGTKRVYQCQVEGCKEGPSTSWAAVCAHMRKVHLGVGLVCPLCSKSIFNLDIFWCHKKKHD